MEHKTQLPVGKSTEELCVQKPFVICVEALNYVFLIHHLVRTYR